MSLPLSGQLGGAQLGGAKLGDIQAAVVVGPQTFTLSGPVPGPRAIPSPTLAYDQTVALAAAVAGPRAIHTPVIAGPLTLSSPVRGPRNILTPRVAGPLSMTAVVAGPRSIPAPTLTVAQTFTLASAVLGPRNIPATHRVANVKTIALAGPVLGPRSIPATHKITGGPQWIAVGTPGFSAVMGPRKILSPSLTGGAPGTFLFLSGVDRTALLREVEGDTIQIQSQTIGRWQGTFALYVSDGSFAPTLGETVVVQDYGRREFAGCLSEVVVERFMSTVQQVVYRCRAVDKSGICDHRVVTGKTYRAADWPDATGVVLDIVANYLNGEGITTQGVPASLGPLESDLNFNFPSVTQAFDQIATLTGTVWWVDPDGILNFSSYSNLPAAPFSLTETSKNWRNLKATATTRDLYNKLYAVSNLNIVPGANNQTGGAQTGNAETVTLSAGAAGTDSRLDPNGRPVGIVMSVGIGSIVSMTVNGHAQTAYDFVNDYKGQTRVDSNDYLWVFAAGNNELSWTYEPPAGATIVVTYVPYVATNVSLAQYGTALTPLDPHGAPLGTCGSGLYEGVLQVQNISSQADLNAIALAYLTRIGGIPTIVEYETDVSGLKPGQLQAINIPNAGIPAKSLLITQITGTHYAADLSNSSDASTHGTFRWQVQATSILDPGNWIKWFERLIARTQNPLPVLQYEVAEFVLAPGGSLSSGISITNPYFAKRTGLAVEILVGAATMPVDQDLVLRFTRNGSVIASVVLHATDAPNVAYATAIPQSNQLYLYKQDALNIDVQYLVTGPNPAPAANVSASLRWGM